MKDQIYSSRAVPIFERNGLRNIKCCFKQGCGDNKKEIIKILKIFQI